MNRKHGLLLLCIVLFITASIWLSSWESVQLKRVVLSQWSRINPDAPNANFDALFYSFKTNNYAVTDGISYFIEGEKKAALKAIQNEWQLNTTTLTRLVSYADERIKKMNKKSTGLMVWQTKKPKRAIMPLVKKLLSENGIKQGALKIEVDAPIYYPNILFSDRPYQSRKNGTIDPYFILAIPRNFSYHNKQFQQGNLEHELMHMKCGHCITASHIIEYLSNRDKILDDEIMFTPSMKQWMRACEYEADLLSAAKSIEAADAVYAAVQGVTASDEWHPATPERLKMIARVKRFLESEQRCEIKSA